MDDDTPLAFSQRPHAPCHLPDEGALAAAATLAYVRGDASFLPGAELEAQRQRIEALRDPTAPDSLDELARQLPTLEALWHRFTVEAMQAGSPDVRTKYLKAALQAQQAFARTFTLLRGLRLQQLGSASVGVIDDDSDTA